MGTEYRRTTLNVVSPGHFPPILRWDDMEELLKWEKSGTGSDYTVALDTTDAYNGAQSLKLLTRTTTPTTNDYVKAKNYFAPHKQTELFISFYFKYLLDGSTLQGPNLSLIIKTPDWHATLGFYFDNDADEIYIIDSDGNYSVLPEAPSDFVANKWSLIQLHADLKSGTYKSLVCNGGAATVNGTAFKTTVNSGAPQGGTISFQAKALSDDQVGYLIDDFLVAEEGW